MRNKKTLSLAALVFLLGASPGPAATLKIGAKSFTVDLPAGLTIESLATNMESPRLMAFASNGDLLVGSQGGFIYRLRPPYVQAEELVNFGGYPHSVALRKTAAGEELWVAETTGLYRGLYQANRSYTKADFTLVAPLPGGPGHNSRTVAVGPDQKIYVSLGISGNCSDEYLNASYPFNKRRGGILILEEKPNAPAALIPYASGLRNPVGFAWDPQSGELFASNNGPDHLGFDRPREEIVQVQAGDFFGMPWYQVLDGVVTRDSCIKSEPPRPAADVKLPKATLPARSAPLGLAIAGPKDLGGSFTGQLFVAVHGSWGTPPSGSALGNAAGRRQPQIARIQLKEAALSPGLENFVGGFQDQQGDRWGRPAGITFGPDGSLYFTSDDGQQGLYRVKQVSR